MDLVHLPPFYWGGGGGGGGGGEGGVRSVWFGWLDPSGDQSGIRTRKTIATLSMMRPSGDRVILIHTPREYEHKLFFILHPTLHKKQQFTARHNRDHGMTHIKSTQF